MLVKLDGRPAAGHWEEHPVNLEELVLAYLSRPTPASPLSPQSVDSTRLQ
jgi:hypothetical protein